MIRNTFNMGLASLVAWRCESLKCGGAVTSVSFTLVPRYSSAVSFFFVRTVEDTSSGWSFCSSPMKCTWIIGFSPEPDLPAQLRQRTFGRKDVSRRTLSPCSGRLQRHARKRGEVDVAAWSRQSRGFAEVIWVVTIFSLDLHLNRVQLGQQLSAGGPLRTVSTLTLVAIEISHVETQAR